jgi:uncharacterized protein DUF6152
MAELVCAMRRGNGADVILNRAFAQSIPKVEAGVSMIFTKHVFGLLVAAASLQPLWAHHSFAAEYDANKPLVLKGVVTKMEWMNPHSRFYLSVADETGKTVVWNIELLSPNVLVRQGWRRDSVKIGETLTVEASQAKDGSNFANAQRITLSDGRSIYSGPAGDAAGSPARGGK